LYESQLWLRRFNSRRDGVYDPIAVSRLRGRSRYGAAKARLDRKKSSSVSSVPGEPAFERGEYQPKSPKKSKQLLSNSNQFGQQWVVMMFCSFLSAQDGDY